MLKMNVPSAILCAAAAASCSAINPVGGKNQLVNNREFGFSVHFPAGQIVCLASSGDHPHGFYANLDADCRKQDSDRATRSLGIWANYNAANWDMSDLIRVYCHNGSPERLLQAKDSFKIDGLPSQYCFFKDSSGSLILYVLAERGSAAEKFHDPNAKGGYVNYRATLVTKPESYQRDLETFTRFVKSISLRKFG